jgi:hypothetical protein
MAGAIAFWTTTGMASDRLNRLHHVQVQIADLPGSRLGLAFGGNQVWIDDDAAGYGWYERHREQGSDGARGSSVDLLSVITHEFGHLLGFGHDSQFAVMDAYLAPGDRHVPARDMAVERLFALADPLGNRPSRWERYDRSELIFGRPGLAENAAGDWLDAGSAATSHRKVRIDSEETPHIERHSRSMGNARRGRPDQTVDLLFGEFTGHEYREKPKSNPWNALGLDEDLLEIISSPRDNRE